MDVCGSTTTDDSFFNCCSCSIQRIFHTKLSFFHLSLCSCTYTDNSNSTCKFCKSLLKFLSVEIRCCLFDCFLDLSNTVCDCVLVSTSVNDNCILFLNLNRFCTSELIHCSFFKIESKFFRNHLSTCQNCDILKHLFSSVTISRCFYCYNVECSTQFIHDQSCKCLTFDILSDNKKSCTRLNDLLKNRKDLLDIGNLLVCDQDIWIIKNSFHLLHISCHICRNISTVKLHTFYKVKLCLHCLGLFDCDNSVVGYFFHCICNHLSDFIIS